ncbi:MULTISPECIES: formylglycine-generating enzyme family protein [unclassified Bradyrhizobium]|uniref:formylglycine-generating enzyme family protein n=1 Tax=unclassified Bradyrhizobium TaxID=2631580 RepID=UPI001CD7FFF7|nr:MULTISPECIES: formylglycine-generating enzyme family protein [unclassified Bradyrhizobium]MCA1427380.1 formylglycine-generating enzyme family protein [Bradyrhizobium sp. NBAIM16]MCA1506900.1 formylglycine-generating enzyme family protein [Bradyrhizobium sp. NBAIM02]
MKWRSIALRCGLMAITGVAFAEAGQRENLGKFAIDRTEVTIGQFRNFAADKALKTAAEQEGGGHEFAGGWIRRSGWTWATPFGEPGSDDEPAVHVSWNEARDYCLAVGGRLPTLEEWERAAYTETRANPTDDFVNGRTYPYPVGDRPDGMNTSDRDRWPRHAAVGTTKRGVNGLYDMGGNVWEWLADRRGDEALTAGGSWWYGADKTKASAVQWKSADFHAVYIGLRCVYTAQ